jgi:hypothetical protein
VEARCFHPIHYTLFQRQRICAGVRAIVPCGGEMAKKWVVGQFPISALIVQVERRADQTSYSPVSG